MPSPGLTNNDFPFSFWFCNSSTLALPMIRLVSFENTPHKRRRRRHTKPRPMAVTSVPLDYTIPQL